MTTKQDLPPTAAHVLDHLRWSDGSLTVSTLVERTGRHPRTVREAAETLAEEDFIKYSWTDGDPRERRLELRDTR